MVTTKLIKKFSVYVVAFRRVHCAYVQKDAGNLNWIEYIA